MDRVKGKVALVTGAAQGIGAAIARLFASEGATVILTDTNGAQGEAVAREIGAEFHAHDVSSEADWKRVIAAVQSRHGGLDVLVNNAGIRSINPIEDTSLEEFRRIMHVNVDSVFLGIQASLPAMRDRAKLRTAGGAIVNISSVHGIKGSANNIAYATSKGAVRHLTKCAAIEFAQLGYNIRVNSVHPAVVDTPMITGTQEGPKGEADAKLLDLAKRVPLGRVATAEEVASMVMFVASDDCGFTTGAEFAVDGGRLAA